MDRSPDMSGAVLQGTALQPIVSAMDRIGAHCNGYSLACPWTSRTARSRTSGAYVLGRPIGRSSQRMGPPGNPARFILL
jgi:hypothetical protein